jgi:hypothetical protein
MNGPKQPQISPLLPAVLPPAVSPTLGETAATLTTLWEAEWCADSRLLKAKLLQQGSPTPLLDEFSAVRHELSAAEPRRSVPQDDNPIYPVRSELAPGQRFRGKHGNLVVTKRK